MDAKAVFEDHGMQRWLQLLDDPVRRSQNRDQPPKRITCNNGHTKLAEMGLTTRSKSEETTRKVFDSELGAPNAEFAVFILSKNGLNVYCFAPAHLELTDVYYRLETMPRDNDFAVTT